MDEAARRFGDGGNMITPFRALSSSGRALRERLRNTGRRLAPYAKPAFFGSLVAVAALLGVLWGPAEAYREQAADAQAERALRERHVHVSPAELAILLRNRQVPLALFDLRDESSYNVLHILDAKRPQALAQEVRGLPEKTVKILIDGDERTANEAYRALARSGAKQVYVLAGGMRAWLASFGQPQDGAPTILAGAYGSRHPASYPDPEKWKLPEFVPMVKLGGAAKRGPGGCGG